MSGPLLRLEGVSKRFGGLAAVDGVGFTVAAGSICGVIGPNGAGKSTLFNLIAGEIAPDAGRIELAGDDIAGLPSHQVARRGLGRSFQLVNLFDSMDVRDNVLLAAEDHARMRLWSATTHLGGYRRRRREALGRAETALHLVGIAHLGARSVGSLSFGQQRLVGAARAMASQPRMLLLDEPASGLSQEDILVLRDAILRMRDTGAAVLVVEHNVEFVMGLCAQVVVMNFGRKIADGTPEAVRNSEAVIEAYLGRSA